VQKIIELRDIKSDCLRKLKAMKWAYDILIKPQNWLEMWN